METIKQAIKYGVVGLSNTLITMIVIWVMMKLFGCREGLSNLTGYVAGILNSFIWNKQWTFKGSSTGWTKGAVRFTIAFIICYALQYGLVLILNSRLTIDHYYNHLIGMAFYTVINFLVNLEDFDQEGIREMTKPLFSIPPHQFLFNAGSIDKRSYMEMLQLDEAEYNLIKFPQRGVCLYKCGNERYLLAVHAPAYKEKLFGTAGGR